MTEFNNQAELETITVSPQQVMKQAQQRLMELSGQNIHGKDYKTVAVRVKVFREFFPSYGLTTNIVEKTDNHCLIKAIVYSPANRILATGYAEEDKKTNKVNMTSMIENCETSAVGRALGIFGLAGDEMASANEMEKALAKEKLIKEQESEQRLKDNFDEKGKFKK